MAEGGTQHPDGDDAAAPADEAQLASAVDAALTPELKRQRARFVQAIMGADRWEGVGRREAEREDRDSLERDVERDVERDLERPDDPAD